MGIDLLIGRMHCIRNTRDTGRDVECEYSKAANKKYIHYADDSIFHHTTF